MHCDKIQSIMEAAMAGAFKEGTRTKPNVSAHIMQKMKSIFWTVQPAATIC